MSYRLVKRLPQQGVARIEPGQPGSIWHQSYYNAARATRVLLARGDDLGGARLTRPQDFANVKLAYKVRVYRWRDRVITELVQDPARPETMGGAETFRFFLAGEFATYTRVNFTREWNVGRLYASGDFIFVKRYNPPHPPLPFERPVLVVTSR